MTYRNPKLLALTRHLECVSCGADDGTIVPAHANQGKGMGIKSSDSTVAALCHRCHSKLDQGGVMDKEARREFEREMNLRTLRAMVERGLLRP